MPLARSPTKVSDHALSGSDLPISEPSRIERMEAALAPAAVGEINAVARVKLPPFWKENPLLWFSQVETAFALSRIVSDDTKFRNVVLVLDPSVLSCVADIILSPPETGKYDSLRRRILESFDESSESKLRRLLRGHSMGDEKPSTYLQRLRNLAGGQCSETILKTLFLEQMPENFRVILAINEDMDLGKLALQADKLFEIVTPGVAAVADVRPPSIDIVVTTTKPYVDLSERLTEILKRLQRLETRDAGEDRFRRRDRKFYKSRERRTRSKSRDGLCRLHAKYGADARHCFPPCKWTSQSHREN